MSANRVIKRFDEIQTGDIGSFGGRHRWMATGPFAPARGTWGSFPIVSNDESKDGCQVGHIQGDASSIFLVWDLGEINPQPQEPTDDEIYNRPGDDEPAMGEHDWRL